MGLFGYYGVKVKWNSGRREMFRYATPEEAEAKASSLWVDNMRQVKYADYVGWRFDWRFRELRLRLFGPPGH